MAKQQQSKRNRGVNRLGESSDQYLRRKLAGLKIQRATLQRQVLDLKRERLVLAKLASKTPQFYNPLVAFEAEALRDRILAAGE